MVCAALERICRESEEAIDEGYSIVILSDRNISDSRIPVSTLIATGAFITIWFDKKSEPRLVWSLRPVKHVKVHHHCLLIGYGADAINPYVAFEALWQAYLDGMFPGDEIYESPARVEQMYRKAVAKGMLKVMAKMGISTLRSYKGAQIFFEAVGLASDVIDQCFVGTASRIEGGSLDVLAEEALRRFELGYPGRSSTLECLKQFR